MSQPVMIVRARSRRPIAIAALALGLALVSWAATACNAISAANCSTNSETGANEGPEMSPGSNCMNCHSGGAGEGQRGGGFQIAGTVMGAVADATECDGISGATITITDAAGKTTTMTANGVGNFYSQASISMPYTAKVSRNGKELAMQTPQSDGACGSCHTESGANGAAGRIIAP